MTRAVMTEIVTHISGARAGIDVSGGSKAFVSQPPSFPIFPSTTPFLLFSWLMSYYFLCQIPLRPRT